MSYPPELQELIVGRLLRHEVSLRSASEVYGVGRSTLAVWRRKALMADNGTLPLRTSAMQEMPMPSAPVLPTGWTRFQMIAAVAMMDEMSAEQFGAYCRRKGIHAGVVREWKAWFDENPELYTASEVSCMRHEMHKQRADLTKANKTIEKQNRKLARNEKALAEYAALVVLSKKLDAIWDKDEAE